MITAQEVKEYSEKHFGIGTDKVGRSARLAGSYGYICQKKGKIPDMQGEFETILKSLEDYIENGPVLER